tara:strand:- start:378 stop:770 length:393 start_codon:yes stop_codon:yes gene_type:complete
MRGKKNQIIKPFVYKCTLDRVVDGDTVDVNLDLGFSIILAKQRVRLAGIDTPESRTRDLAEKKLGLQAKELLKELTCDGFVLESQGRGKYGRILGVLWDFDGNSINQKLIESGLAVEYWGGTKVKIWGDY